MDSRVRPGGPPLLCAKPRGERMGHPAMFLSVGKVNLMQHKTVSEVCRNFLLPTHEYFWNVFSLSAAATRHEHNPNGCPVTLTFNG